MKLFELETRRSWLIANVLERSYFESVCFVHLNEVETFGDLTKPCTSVCYVNTLIILL